MANQNYSGSRYRSSPDAREDRASWSPNDDQNRTDREPEDRGVQDRNRWSYTDHDTGNFDREREPMPTERYGQGQSGYSAGRNAADRSQGYQNRNQMYPSGGHAERSSRTGPGLDDRFVGRGGGTDWGQRSDYQPDRWGQSDRVRDSGSSREPQRFADRRPSSSGDSVSGHRGKGPKNWQRSDERIREAVNEALADHDEIDATHILVTVKDGEITLTGTVEDRRMKRLAEDCVEQVSGVKEVQNQIRLQGSEQTAGNGNIRSGAPAQSTASDDRKPRA